MLFSESFLCESTSEFIDPVFQASPPITDPVDHIYADSFLEQVMPMSNRELKPQARSQQIPERRNFRAFPSNRINTKLVFRHEEIVHRKEAPASSLTALLNQSSNRSIPDEKANKLLLIYLPNQSSINVRVRDDSTVQDVIKKTLSTHEMQNISPPLLYKRPDLYELRHHEEDGCPDMDFLISGSKQWKELGSKEFCLCEKYGFDEAAGDSAAPVSSSSSSTSTLTAVGQLGGAASVDTVKIVIPNSSVFTPVHLEADTTVVDLLPLLAKKLKLRLYTETYIFTLLPEDQNRLKLTSPVVDRALPIAKCGIQTLILQRKIYEDASVQFRYRDNAQAQSSSNLTSNSNNNQQGSINNNKSTGSRELTFRYTDQTAAEYQEWKVIKKNKFGRKQERIFGVDSFFVYNSKRDRDGFNSRSDKSKRVHRAQRGISTIKRIVRVDGAVNTFKISWQDEGESVDIEYTCEQERDVSEIMAKIIFLLSRRADA